MGAERLPKPLQPTQPKPPRGTQKKEGTQRGQSETGPG